MSDLYGKQRVEEEEEFQEEDMWGSVGIVNEKDNDSSLQVKKKKKAQRRHSASSSAWSSNTAPRMNIINNNSNISRAQEFNVVPHQQSSAPLNVPDWSKIYNGRKSNNSWVHNGHEGAEKFMQNGGFDIDEDDEEEMVPPHEYIARKMARAQISSFSMCEGVGRTLKGRDLSKLRDAILTKTGFLE